MYTYDRRSYRTAAAMQIGKWYKQKFSDSEIYFLAKAEQKNGGLSGIAVRVDMLRPRAAPKAKKDSVPKNFGSLWKEVPESDVPSNVKSHT
jgi:hypothetical protein